MTDYRYQYSLDNGKIWNGAFATKKHARAVGVKVARQIGKHLVSIREVKIEYNVIHYGV